MAKSDVLVRMKADTQGYDANIAKARRQLDQFKKDNLSMGGVLKQLNSSLITTAAKFASVTAVVGALGAAFKSNIETARNFEKSMSQLSSLTGMVGEDLNKLKEYSIELGSTTTLSASQVADAFKMIGSQQPQLLSSGEALKSVTKNAITLAEAAGIELADAANTLSVSINQMGGDSSNAERFINVLAAASQKGAGDIVWLGEAITKSGTTAKAVGTSYEELVANLEQLAKAGYDASTAGTALRSIIMNLEKQSNQNFKPSVVGLTEAFKNLGEANLTLTQYQEIAGKMFAAQAKALADAAGEAENMREQITGTNTAEEQAKTNTDNLDGSLKSLASAWEGLNLHINSSNGLLRDAVDWLKDVVVWADKAYQALEKYYNGPESFDDKMNRLAEEYDQSVYEIPEVTVTGKKPAPKPTRTKTTGGGSKAKVPTVADFEKFNMKTILGADALKGSDDANFLSVWANTSDEAKKKFMELNTEVTGLNETFNNLTEWTIDFKPFDEMTKKLKQEQMAFNMAAQAAQSFGSAIASIGDPSAAAAGTVISAIANIALGFSQAAVQASSMGPYGWIAYLAAGMGAMATTISTIHSLTGYANGGEIKGNSYSGDNLTAMGPSGLIGLNAGEIILNRAQQSNVASGLQGAGSLRGLNLRTKVKGTELLVWLDNSLAQSGRGELVTWGQ